MMTAEHKEDPEYLPMTAHTYSCTKTQHTGTGVPHLEAIGFLGGGCSVPLHQMVVWPVEFLVQLNDEGLEERGELALQLAGVVLRRPELRLSHA